jgi:hypothetical protein
MFRFGEVQPRLVIGVMLLLATGLAFTQGIVTGSISGTALDPQRAVVARARVRATQKETNRLFPTASSDAGVIQLPSLPPDDDSSPATIMVPALGSGSEWSSESCPRNADEAMNKA